MFLVWVPVLNWICRKLLDILYFGSTFWPLVPSTTTRYTLYSIMQASVVQDNNAQQNWDDGCKTESYKPVFKVLKVSSCVVWENLIWKREKSKSSWLFAQPCESPFWSFCEILLKVGWVIINAHRMRWFPKSFPNFYGHSYIFLSNWN